MTSDTRKDVQVYRNEATAELKFFSTQVVDDELVPSPPWTYAGTLDDLFTDLQKEGT